MSSRNDDTHKKKKIDKHPLVKISRKLKDKSIFSCKGSSSQVVIITYQFQRESVLPLTINMAAYPLSANSWFAFAITYVQASTSFPLDPYRGTLPLFEDLPSFTWEDPSQTYLNSFNQLWSRYISFNNVRHIENCNPTNVMLANICQVRFCCLMLNVPIRLVLDFYLFNSNLVEPSRHLGRKLKV